MISLHIEGNASERVNLGGSWFSDAEDCKLSSSSWNNADNRYNALGFRLARSF